MFERFTERARQVVVFAQDIARETGHDQIDSVAILLGLVREENGLAAQVLAELSVEESTVIAAWPHMETESGPAKDPASPQLPFTTDAHKILELALREALSLGHNYIGTEHVLLGLVRREECEAADWLHESGLSPTRIREAVIQRLSGPKPRHSKPKDAYRWIVRVNARDGRDYAREVTTDGPWPDRAIRDGLIAIASGENSIWQQDELTVTAERVR